MSTRGQRLYEPLLRVLMQQQQERGEAARFQAGQQEREGARAESLRRYEDTIAREQQRYDTQRQDQAQSMLMGFLQQTGRMPAAQAQEMLPTARGILAQRGAAPSAGYEAALGQRAERERIEKEEEKALKRHKLEQKTYSAIASDIQDFAPSLAARLRAGQRIPNLPSVIAQLRQSEEKRKAETKRVSEVSLRAGRWLSLSKDALETGNQEQYIDAQGQMASILGRDEGKARQKAASRFAAYQRAGSAQKTVLIGREAKKSYLDAIREVRRSKGNYVRALDDAGAQAHAKPLAAARRAMAYWSGVAAGRPRNLEVEAGLVDPGALITWSVGDPPLKPAGAAPAPTAAPAAPGAAPGAPAAAPMAPAPTAAPAPAAAPMAPRQATPVTPTAPAPTPAPTPMAPPAPRATQPPRPAQPDTGLGAMQQQLDLFEQLRAGGEMSRERMEEFEQEYARLVDPSDSALEDTLTRHGAPRGRKWTIAEGVTDDLNKLEEIYMGTPAGQLVPEEASVLENRLLRLRDAGGLSRRQAQTLETLTTRRADVEYGAGGVTPSAGWGEGPTMHHPSNEAMSLLAELRGAAADEDPEWEAKADAVKGYILKIDPSVDRHWLEMQLQEVRWAWMDEPAAGQAAPASQAPAAPAAPAPSAPGPTAAVHATRKGTAGPPGRRYYPRPAVTKSAIGRALGVQPMEEIPRRPRREMPLKEARARELERTAAGRIRKRLHPDPYGDVRLSKKEQIARKTERLVAESEARSGKRKAKGFRQSPDFEAMPWEMYTPTKPETVGLAKRLAGLAKKRKGAERSRREAVRILRAMLRAKRKEGYSDVILPSPPDKEGGLGYAITDLIEYGKAHPKDLLFVEAQREALEEILRWATSMDEERRRFIGK